MDDIVRFGAVCYGHVVLCCMIRYATNRAHFPSRNMKNVVGASTLITLIPSCLHLVQMTLKVRCGIF